MLSKDFIIENGVLIKYVGKHSEVVVPRIVTEIGEGAFQHCNRLKSVVLLDSVTKIGDNAFAWCKNLKSVEIPESVKEIGDGAFYQCRSLVDREGYVVVRNVLYNYFGKMTAFELPKYITKIGPWAFSECPFVMKVWFSKDVEVHSSAFEGCESMANYDGCVVVNGVLYHYCGPKNIAIIPDGCTEIGESAFKDYGNPTSLQLRRVYIPASVVKIPTDAFSWCEQDCITIHAPANSYAHQYAKENNFFFHEEE